MAVNAARLSEVFLEDDVEKIAESIVTKIWLRWILWLQQERFFSNNVRLLFTSVGTKKVKAARDEAARRRDWPL